MIGGLLFVACDDDKGAKLYDVTVEVMYPDGYEADTYANIPVKMDNMLTGIAVEGVTNAEGIAEFAVEGGTYNITSVFETEEFAFNGILQDQQVDEDDLAFAVQLNATAKTGGLVMSEIFFSGSTTPEDRNYNGDQYVEFYNNSDEVIYLDGLCIGTHGSITSNPSPWVDNDGNLLDVIPITFQSFMFPGTGETYPLQPREVAVLAVTAIDHTAADANPNSPADLSNADFETYVHPDRDVDNPSVPNLIIMYTTSAAMSDWIMATSGNRSVVSWRLPTGLDWETFVDNPDNFMQNPTTGSGFFNFMVHKDWVVDGVELVDAREDRRHKQLPVEVDAGMVWNEAGRGNSVRRKVDKIIDGNIFLKSTKNSSEDWLGSQIPTPFTIEPVID